MIKNLSHVLLICLFLLASCGKTTENEELVTDASFLLLNSSDPSGLPSDPAFLIDDRGPILFDVLDLSDNQKNAIKLLTDSIKMEYGDLCRHWRDSDLTWEEIEAQRDAIRTEIDAAIESLLSDEQKAILSSIETQFANGEYPDELIEKRLEILSVELGLDSDQETAIYTILDSYGSQLLELRDNSNATEFREASHTLFTELATAISSELSAEQATIFDTLLNSHKTRRPPPPHHR
ncbi:MAG: hypothetical protein KDD94_13225 [Calditrichaeota bacterium]|nr:hypothetical protein [Calditrichota bacterium]